MQDASGLRSILILDEEYYRVLNLLGNEGFFVMEDAQETVKKLKRIEYKKERWLVELRQNMAQDDIIFFDLLASVSPDPVCIYGLGLKNINSVRCLCKLNYPLYPYTTFVKQVFEGNTDIFYMPEYIARLWLSVEKKEKIC
jgi:hypothetical protein